MSTDNSVFFPVGNAKLTRRILKSCRDQHLPIGEVRELQCIYGKQYAQVLLGYKVPRAIFDSESTRIEEEQLHERQQVAAKSIHGTYKEQPLLTLVDLTANDVCKRFKVPSKKTKAGLMIPSKLLGLVLRLVELEKLASQVEEVEQFLLSNAQCETAAKQLREVFEIDADYSEPFAQEHAAEVCNQFGIPFESESSSIRVPLSMAALLFDLVSSKYLVDQLKIAETHIVSQRIKKKRADFAERFPQASQRTIESFYNNQQVYASLDDVPLEYLTVAEIEELNLRCGGQANAILLDQQGAVTVPLYLAKLPEFIKTDNLQLRIEREGMTPQCALRIVNKLAKIAASHRKKEVYGVKDTLIKIWSNYLIEGRLTRVERRECNCLGWEHCEDCGGTGVYSLRNLYEHIFKFPDDERTYSFHSYQKPEIISPTKGADKKQFGYRFTQEERRFVSCFHFEEYLKLLRSEVIKPEKRKQLSP